MPLDRALYASNLAVFDVVGYEQFVTLRSCVVEFSLDPQGVSLDRFETWADLAAAADAAEGNLAIAPPTPH